MELLTKSVRLPSNGYFGGPSEITVRGMTTKEEKILLTSKDFSFISKIVKACCVEPENLDISLLHPNDLHYLIFVLREMTFGAKYIQTVSCPFCGLKQDIEVDITDMECTILDTKTIDEKLKVELSSGDILTLKILSQGDIDRIEKEIRKGVMSGKTKDEEGAKYYKTLCETVVDVNGEEFETNDHKLHYLQELPWADTITLRHALSEIKFGLDNTVYCECEKCSEEMEVLGTICPEFFRPTK